MPEIIPGEAEYKVSNEYTKTFGEVVLISALVCLMSCLEDGKIFHTGQVYVNKLTDGLKDSAR